GRRAVASRAERSACRLRVQPDAAISRWRVLPGVGRACGRTPTPPLESGGTTMAEVFNWQLGREMQYPFEAERPRRQIAWVFDTNKCIACQTCTVACKSTWTSGTGQEYMLWNNVETKPYGFFPQGW